jgi:hypothetical protein
MAQKSHLQNWKTLVISVDCDLVTGSHLVLEAVSQGLSSKRFPSIPNLQGIYFRGGLRIGSGARGGLGTQLLLVCRGFHSGACDRGKKSLYVVDKYHVQRRGRFGTTNALGDQGDLYPFDFGLGRRYQQQEKFGRELK